MDDRPTTYGAIKVLDTPLAEVVHHCHLQVAGLDLFIISSGTAVLHATFSPEAHHRALARLGPTGRALAASPAPAHLQAALHRLARGRTPEAPLPCHPWFLERGTPLQQKVWRLLAGIPRGETRTYGEIAAALGNPKLARAVGTACGRNPLALIIPCHRVVAAGGPGGFAGPAWIKETLLERERSATGDGG